MWTAKTVKRPRQQPAQPPIRQQLGAADAQTAHPATSSTAPGTPTTRLREHGNDTSESTGRSDPTQRRDERVTVQGPVKKRYPDGLCHTRGGGGMAFGAPTAILPVKVTLAVVRGAEPVPDLPLLLFADPRCAVSVCGRRVTPVECSACDAPRPCHCSRLWERQPAPLEVQRLSGALPRGRVQPHLRLRVRGLPDRRVRHQPSVAVPRLLPQRYGRTPGPPPTTRPVPRVVAGVPSMRHAAGVGCVGSGRTGSQTDRDGRAGGAGIAVRMDPESPPPGVPASDALGARWATPSPLATVHRPSGWVSP